MKKSVVCCLFLALGLSVLSAGDVATFVDKGFSEDGKYYVFGQYGKTDKKFQGWILLPMIIQTMEFSRQSLLQLQPEKMAAMFMRLLKEKAFITLRI